MQPPLKMIERTARLCAVMILLVVSWLSLAPDPVPVPVPAYVSALSHVVMHFTLGTLFLVGWPDVTRKLLPLLAGYAIAVEALQRFVPTRTFDWLDMVGNLIGLGLAYLFYLALVRFARNLRG